MFGCLIHLCWLVCGSVSRSCQCLVCVPVTRSPRVCVPAAGCGSPGVLGTQAPNVLGWDRMPHTGPRRLTSVWVQFHSNLNIGQGHTRGKGPIPHDLKRRGGGCRARPQPLYRVPGTLSFTGKFHFDTEDISQAHSKLTNGLQMVCRWVCRTPEG